MFDAAQLALFLAAALALNVTPGPDMLYVIGNGIGQGARAGLVAALGIFAGTLVHIALAALGVTALLAAWPLAFDILRWSGALYLAWLGLKALRAAPALARPEAAAPRRLWAVFRQGAVTNVLNPKVGLFFIAFLPQFVRPEAGAPALQILVLGLLFNVQGTLLNAAVAGASGALATGLARSPAAALWLGRVSGVMFLGLAVRLALGDRRPA